ncbi:hypothetical protein C8R43DRAFT_982729 [Mycena crocata]|nr:hypothetical protein C8R43DRAFT_982729 [Mycena crocata]
MSLKRKKVHWSVTVEEYTIQDSPESWTSPLPNTPPTPYLAPVPLPPTATLEVHPALSPAHALQLDFSFPSDAFRCNPQLTKMLLDAPACTPERNVIIVHVAAGVFKENIEVKHSPSGQAVTVGDVLTAVQHRLRTHDRNGVPPETALYARRRIETVNGYCDGRDRRAEAQAVAAESQGKERLVDRLLGHTLFSGLELREGKPDNHWKINLETPLRYRSK